MKTKYYFINICENGLNGLLLRLGLENRNYTKNTYPYKTTTVCISDDGNYFFNGYGKPSYVNLTELNDEQQFIKQLI